MSDQKEGVETVGPIRVQAEVAPRRIRLEVSSACQLRCPSCPTTTGLTKASVGAGLLKFEDFCGVIDQNPQLEQIELSNYGEIFLNPRLLDMLRYAHERKVRLSVTNGVNLNHARSEVLEGLTKYNVERLTCSIDGASQETYKQYRVRGDFDKVIANIETINRFKRQYNSNKPVLTWQYVIFGHNEHEIPLARDMAERLGMRFATKLTWDSDFSPIRDRAFVQAQIKDSATTRAEFEAQHDTIYMKGLCNQLWDDPQINWDGRVLGCCRNFWGEFGGNAFTDGLQASLNSERMRYARGMLTGALPAREDVPCTTCEMYQAMCRRSQFIVRPK